MSQYATIAKRHDLTDVEGLLVLSRLIESEAHYALRRERYPNDPKKGSDGA